MYGPRYGLAAWVGDGKWYVYPSSLLGSVGMTARPPLAIVRPIDADVVDWHWPAVPENLR
jgi:hypothetical protein